MSEFLTTARAERDRLARRIELLDALIEEYEPLVEVAADTRGVTVSTAPSSAPVTWERVHVTDGPWLTRLGTVSGWTVTDSEGEPDAPRAARPTEVEQRLPVLLDQALDIIEAHAAGYTVWIAEARAALGLEETP